MPRCELYARYFRERLHEQAEPFAFVAGGTVQAGGGIYLDARRRRAARALPRRRLHLHPDVAADGQVQPDGPHRRTARHEAALPVVVDLTEFGAQTTAEQWYKGFLPGVQDQPACARPRRNGGRAGRSLLRHKFTRYLREVALKERRERLVVFVDEIDTTLRLDFTDDFFAAIRFLYQHRAAEPALRGCRSC